MFRALVTLSLILNLNTGTEQPPLSVDAPRFEMASLLHVPMHPIKKFEYIAPVIDAKGALAVDIATGEVLFSRDMHERRPMASLTKIMTAIVVLEENELDDVVTVSRRAADIDGSTLYLKMGEQFTVHDLVKSLLIVSANDAAYALAEHNAGTVEKFVQKMNKKAELLGLANTQFSNPAGFDHTDHYSSPYDLALMGRYAYKKQVLRDIVKTQETIIASLKGKSRKLENTNKLLGSFLNVEGMKTGKTDLAGLCLMTVAAHPEGGHKVMTVLLNSPDRFKESKILLDWIFRAFEWYGNA